MTNPTDLLPRFAAASEWLAENHPDAPRLPGWIVVDQGVMYMRYADETVIHDPACLSGAVVWAMEVAEWISSEQMGWAIVKSNVLDFERERFGNIQWSMFVYSESMSISREDKGKADTPAEAWLLVLESICESLGREG